MPLNTETKRIVGVYEYTDADVNIGVKEFLRQMSTHWDKAGG
jgi:hypothetical protein